MVLTDLENLPFNLQSVGEQIQKFKHSEILIKCKCWVMYTPNQMMGAKLYFRKSA